VAQPEQFAFFPSFPGVLVRIIEIHRWIFEPDASFGFVAFGTEMNAENNVTSVAHSVLETL
jgi:hypothetical protein